VPGPKPVGRPWHGIRRFPLIYVRADPAPEDDMTNIDPPDSTVCTVLHDATVDLRDVALRVDSVSALLDPTMELLEASHAIHRALILLNEWCDLTGADRLIEA